jgi:transposase
MNWPRGRGILFTRVNELLESKQFDEFAEKECARFYAENNGRPSVTPGIYFRLLLVGYFEGIDSERGIAWRAVDSIGLRKFLGVGLDEQTPDHSTISRTRRLIDVETHQKVFLWILELLRDQGLLKGKTVGINATTLEANAAMRSIVRRDNGESYEEFLKGVGEGIGDRNADARRSGAVGSHAEEQSQQQRLGQSARWRRAD